MDSCKTPYQVRTKMNPNETIPVPCGKCPVCLARRVSGWSFRLMQQDKVSITSHFITLTYDTDYVPITSKGFMCLCKRDVQLFLKRLRKMCNANDYTKISYYAVGEYGSKSMRPHYHLLMFDANIELIQPAWQRGQVHYGTVTGASIGYCLKYMCKPKRIPLHQNDDRIREFALMSKGLGKSYLTPAVIRWHHANKFERMYIPIDSGKKIAMPRYYKQKIYTEQQRKGIGLAVRQEQLKQQERLVALGKAVSSRDQAERDKVAFAKMYKDSLNNRDLL